MLRILVTAFGPYDTWNENSSWLALLELTRDLPTTSSITTRKYPVDFDRTREQLFDDLHSPFDVMIFLGQAPGSHTIALESTALNVRSDPISPDLYEPLEPGAPAAYITGLPLWEWADQLRLQGIPARVSHHAGTYLCNALYYWGQWIVSQQNYPCACVFLHLPLAPQQAAGQLQPLASMPSALAAHALRCILGICERGF